MTVANIDTPAGKMKRVLGKKRGEFYLLSATPNRHAWRSFLYEHSV
jgi:hypothetical protein